MNPTLTTIVLTVSSVLIALTVVQVMFFYLSKRRDSIKERKEIIQEFVFPYLNEVLLYIEMKTDHRKKHGVEFVVFRSDDIISKIQWKIGYGNAALMNALYRYFQNNSYNDEKSEAKKLAIFEVFYRYLDYAYAYLGKSEYKDQHLLDVILKNQKIYGIAFVLTTLLGEEEALDIISHKWLWTHDFLNKISVSLLEDLINNYHNATTEEHKLLYFLSTLNSDFVDSPEVDRYDHLKGFLEETIDIVKNRWVHYSN